MTYSITVAGIRFECDEFESAEDMGWAFSSDGITPFTEIVDVYQFVGRAFHIMQQVGGKLTKYDMPIMPSDFEQTNGSLANKDWWVKYGEDEQLVQLGKIING